MYRTHSIAEPQVFLHALKNQSEIYWMARGERRVLKLFHRMAEEVPAYKDFLHIHKIDHHAIKTIQDFKLLPLTTKENYLRAYSLPELCWRGDLGKKTPLMFSATSGSTGEPFYFPRQFWQDIEFAFTAELMLRDFFQLEKKSTLFIDCFALGIWIGGMYMYQALKYISDTLRYPLSIITPGAYKEEAIKAVQRIGKQFDQIIIGGYAPLVKDLLDDGAAEGVKWSAYNLKFFFAAEGFSEDFRDYIIKKSGARDTFTSSFNHYGTADMGTMAHETPLTILTRRLALEQPHLLNSLFGDYQKLPTVTQFIPELFFFEEIEKSLICSSFSGIPLVRYDLKDRGGVCTLNELYTRCNDHGIDVLQEERNTNLDQYHWSVPLVYVFERKDFTVSIYSVNIYPDSIRRALERAVCSSELTTKFTMIRLCLQKNAIP
jgi:phenylacetate-CoA ligase